MTKVKNQPRKQKQSAARTPSRAQTHDKAMLADIKAGHQMPDMEPMPWTPVYAALLFAVWRFFSD